MKAFCLSLIFCATLSVGVKAQILIGPEAGFNTSWTRFDDKDLRDQYAIKPVLGYHVGFHAGFRVQKRYFLHAAFLYSTKGRVIESKPTTVANHAEELHNKMRLNYLEMPLTYLVEFKHRLGGGNKEVKFAFGGGPNISYWLGGKGTLISQEVHEAGLSQVNYKIVFSKESPSPKNNQMMVGTQNRMQLGLNIVGSVIFEPLPARRVMLTVRYELGHSYLSGTSNGKFFSTEYVEPLQSRNKGIRVSLAYLLDLRTDQRKKGKSVSDKKKSTHINVRKRR